MANQSEAASAAADPQMGGITVSIGPDGSTTISIVSLLRELRV